MATNKVIEMMVELVKRGVKVHITEAGYEEIKKIMMPTVKVNTVENAG